MSKLAVILFLFALCAVAMTARIAREKPIQNFPDGLQNSIRYPEFQKTLERFAGTLQDFSKKFTDSSAKILATPKP